jgi:hypothetical protein
MAWRDQSVSQQVWLVRTNSNPARLQGNGKSAAKGYSMAVPGVFIE